MKQNQIVAEVKIQVGLTLDQLQHLENTLTKEGQKTFLQNLQEGANKVLEDVCLNQLITLHLARQKVYFLQTNPLLVEVQYQPRTPEA